jgi:hypothetical protein
MNYIKQFTLKQYGIALLVLLVLYMTFSRQGPIVFFLKKKLTEKEKKKFLFLHNNVRNKCNKSIQKLEWDEKLAEYATKTATHLANNRFGKLIHANSYVDISAGENLAFSKNMDDPIRVAINGWAGEGYGDDATTSQTGHYTAMNWSTVNKVGCGMAKSSFGTIVSCNYKSPDGIVSPNTMGTYDKFVKCTKPISV